MKTLLDTNVLSELLRPAPEPAVVTWVATHAPDSLFVSAVTQAEMMLGARLLPAGKRRSMLESALLLMFQQEFSGHVLPFDTATVPFYVDVVARRRAAGRPVTQFDAQIAAIALHGGMRLATRNVSDFEGCGLVTINPWSHQEP